jgi:hypothetical protein
MALQLFSKRVRESELFGYLRDPVKHFRSFSTFREKGFYRYDHVTDKDSGEELPYDMA